MDQTCQGAVPVAHTILMLLQGDAGVPGVDGRPGLEGFPGPQVGSTAPSLPQTCSLLQTGMLLSSQSPSFCGNLHPSNITPSTLQGLGFPCAHPRFHPLAGSKRQPWQPW